MPTTRRQILETLQRLMLGGMASDDTELTINLINQHLNGAIGYAAKTNYKEEIQLNGIENVADAFYSNFTDILITLNTTTGLYNATLPQQPVGIGAGWDISTFMLITGSGAKIFAHPISPREIEFIYNTSGPCNEVFYWVSGLTVTLHSCKDITKYKADIRMLSSQSSNFDSPINLPDGYLPLVMEYLSKILGIEVQRPIDISNDGVETPQVR
jgi:hypothetical protein